MASDYRGFRYYLGTAADRDKFVGGQLDDGEINDLLEGFFAELVARQRLDDDAFVGKTTLF